MLCPARLGSCASCAMRCVSSWWAFAKCDMTVSALLEPPEMSFAGLLGSMMDSRLVSLYVNPCTWCCDAEEVAISFQRPEERARKREHLPLEYTAVGSC